MRKGTNPNNHKNVNKKNYSHRVIIPVHIPNLEGYFSDSVKVFKVCMNSLLKTNNSDTCISIISNGCCDEVNDYILDLAKRKKIDRAVFYIENVGKMNAVVAEARASFEPYITFSDADVFFDKGWLKQTYEIFKTTPKAGFVSVNPAPRNYYYVNSTVLDNLSVIFFRKKNVKDICVFGDLEHFHKSIGRDNNETIKVYNSEVFCVGGRENYIIGAGHFCCTVRKSALLKYIPAEPSNFGISGDSEAKYLDIPFDKTGLWRLSSPKAYVWHMGNILEESWAEEKLKSLEHFKEEEFQFLALEPGKPNVLVLIIPYSIRKRIISLFKKLNILS